MQSDAEDRIASGGASNLSSLGLHPYCPGKFMMRDRAGESMAHGAIACNDRSVLE